MAAQFRVHTLSRRRQWRHALKAWLPGTLAGLFGFGGLVYTTCVVQDKEGADVQGAPARRGAGVVASVSYPNPSWGENAPAAIAAVRVSGQSVAFRTHALLRQNERVQVTYRVGRSGRIHIDGLKPAGETKP